MHEKMLQNNFLQLLCRNISMLCKDHIITISSCCLLINLSLNLLNWSPVLLLHGQDVEAACRRAVAVPPLDVGQDLVQVRLDPHDPLQLRRHLALLLFSQDRVIVLLRMRVGVQRQPGALGRLLKCMN